MFSVGELNFDLFLTSSNNLTATVESNAATEKKNAQTKVGFLTEGRGEKFRLQPLCQCPNITNSVHSTFTSQNKRQVEILLAM